jgi:hypothetical protein
MSRSDYERELCMRLSGAPLVPFKKVSLGKWLPAISKCHENVKAWVDAMREHSAIRGWVVCGPCLSGAYVGVNLTAHSVVRDETGVLFDITPIHDERQRMSMRFIPHIGDDGAFQAMKDFGIFICCPECVTQSR